MLQAIGPLVFGDAGAGRASSRRTSPAARVWIGASGSRRRYSPTTCTVELDSMPPTRLRYAGLAALLLATSRSTGFASPPPATAQDVERTDSLDVHDGMLHYRVAG